MKIRTTVTILSFCCAVWMSIACGSNANAKQYVQNYNGRQVVVHTNPIPVFLHRMVPPQHGRHVTQKEIQQGKLPVSRTAPTPVIVNKSDRTR
jgi:hypothetical protein